MCFKVCFLCHKPVHISRTLFSYISMWLYVQVSGYMCHISQLCDYNMVFRTLYISSNCMVIQICGYLFMHVVI